MNKTLIFGHKNPDTDTICSSLAYAMYKQAKGYECEAVKLGELNKETQFVFNHLGIEVPRTITDIEDGQEVIMIDHNEFSQSVENIENATILEVIDHHRVDNFHTAQPLMMNLQPLGCSATIIYKMMKQEGFELDKAIALLLCSAIVSDSLLFQSPTCTKEDEEVCRELANIAGVEVERYGMEMLKAGTDLSDYSASELINIDAKTFDTSYGKVNIAQVNTVSVEDVLSREEEITKVLETKLSEEGLAQIILMITDIIKAESMCLVIGNHDEFNQRFNVTIVDNKVVLPGVLSRKKQIVPFL